MRISIWIPFLLVGVTACGCASFTGSEKTKPKSKKDSSWFSWNKKEYQVPSSMAVIWTEDILHTPGKPSTRGFGGRIYFYNEKSQAIPVEGELLVYGYDESSPKPVHSVASAADKRFRFTSEQFTQHFSESDLGASYSVWIPWDAVGGPHRKITLIPSFVATGGKVIRGESAKLNLSGKAPASQTEVTPSTVQQVSHVEPTNTTILNSNQGLRTTTIQLPNATARRLQVPTVSESSSSAVSPIPQMNSTPSSVPPTGPVLGTAVTYGNGMTAEQMQEAIRNGTYGQPAISPSAMQLLQTQQQLLQSRGQFPQNGFSGPGQTQGMPTGIPNPQNASSNGNRGFSNPSTMPPPATGRGFNDFATPEFPQVDWSGLSAHSLSRQSPAPTSASVPTGSYLTR